VGTRRLKPNPGGQKPGQAKYLYGRKNHHTRGMRDAYRKLVGKSVREPSRKAAIVENPKAGGRSIVKELGKMTP